MIGLKAASWRGYSLLALSLMWAACADDEPTKAKPDMADLGKGVRDMGAADLGPEEMTAADMKVVDMNPGQLRVEGDGLLLKVAALGEVQSQKLSLVNETDSPVILGSVTLDERAEDALAELSLASAPTALTLAPGEQAEVTVSYRPLNGVDDSAQLSFLVTAGGKMNIVSAFIFAKFEPGPELNYPETISFGAVAAGESRRMSFAVYNNTETQVRLRDMYLAPLPSPFSFKIAAAAAPEDGEQDTAYVAEQPIEPKQPLWISVTYKAADDQPQQADLVFVSTLGTRQVRLNTP